MKSTLQPFEPLKISDKAYRYIANLVYETSRIRLGADKHALVSGRLGKRLRHLRLTTFEDYCRYLDSPQGVDEIGELVDSISTNHTQFFREIDHLNYLTTSILPEWVPKIARANSVFRFWSAACSSGEEPYTAAIVLAEYARNHGNFTWQIEASDISARILQRAQKAIYEGSKITLPHPEWVPRYFQKGQGDFNGYFKVSEFLSRQVKFHRLNLLQSSYPVAPNQHVIFWRNVMIYFDNTTQQELINKLSNQLIPGGYLVVGHSESLLAIQHCLQSVRPGIYRKP